MSDPKPAPSAEEALREAHDRIKDIRYAMQYGKDDGAYQERAALAAIDAAVAAARREGELSHGVLCYRASGGHGVVREAEERTRIEYQHPMECGHAKGALLTCTETEPSGCLWCIDKAEWQQRIAALERENVTLEARLRGAHVRNCGCGWSGTFAEGYDETYIQPRCAALRAGEGKP